MDFAPFSFLPFFKKKKNKTFLSAALNIPGTCFDGPVPRPRAVRCHLVPPPAAIVADGCLLVDRLEDGASTQAWLSVAPHHCANIIDNQKVV